MSKLQELLKWYQEGHEDGDHIETKEVVFKIMDLIDKETPKTFEEACEPLMKWLSENKHPMCRVIVDCSNAELLEGLQTHVNDSFIQD